LPPKQEAEIKTGRVEPKIQKQNREAGQQESRDVNRPAARPNQPAPLMPAMSGTFVDAEPAVEQALGRLFLQYGTDGRFGEASLSSLTPRSLLSVGRDGRVVREIAPSSRMIYDYRLSPDGRLLAFDAPSNPQGIREVWLLDPIRGTQSRLTFQGGATAPVWAPDGRAVAYAVAPERAIYRKNANGIGQPQILVSQPSAAIPPYPIDWSPDGRLLLYQVFDVNTGWDLWMMPLTGDPPAPYLVSPFSEGSARFSPDGKWLAYTSNESGRDEIFMRSLANLPGKWQVSIAGGRAPRWRRDGQELFYIGPNGNVMSVDVFADPDLRLGSPVSLFQSPFAAAGPIGFIAPFEVEGNGQFFILLGGSR
jgi:hypothetical protein